jgi:hypothetical protein
MTINMMVLVASEAACPELAAPCGGQVLSLMHHHMMIGLRVQIITVAIGVTVCQLIGLDVIAGTAGQTVEAAQQWTLIMTEDVVTTPLQ